MRYVINKEVIRKQIRALARRGGGYTRAAERIQKILGSIITGEPDPFHGIPVTNHGETRVKNCIKYDLAEYCRLITIKDNGVCIFMYAGTHDDCDRWLNGNKGRTIVVGKDNDLNDIIETSGLVEGLPDEPDEVPLSEGTLMEKLRNSYRDYLMSNMKGDAWMRMMKLDSLSEDDELMDAVGMVQDDKFGMMLLDMLLHLRRSEIDRAHDRILLHQEEIARLSSLSQEEVGALSSSENYIFAEDLDGTNLGELMEGSGWYDWMLFMHPQQRSVVEKDFNGPARLLGVSGSGKTSIIVNRAVRLAALYQEPVLITTLNPALASLIRELVAKALASRSETLPGELIEVKSFWDLSREMLLEYEQDSLLRKGYTQFSHKDLDDVDQVWSEFYRCQANNNDAEVLLPLHRSLSSRGIKAQVYLKQELDWLRSAFSPSARTAYMIAERKGRVESIQPAQRELIMKGLLAWEDKMQSVGVCDYLGLVGPLQRYTDKITPRYRCILVDELQDFGTTELRIIRMLVSSAENDLFLCGDIAQQVHTKHHKLNEAGIRILPQNYMSIRKNYRNSKEILEAAAHVFSSNIDRNAYKDDDFELLDPEYANYSRFKPFVRQATSIGEELGYALAYLRNELSVDQKGCIAICGLTYFEVSALGKNLSLPVLSGGQDLNDRTIFLTDLEQSKGFEFDIVVVINCGTNVFPDPRIPRDERFREISKLYVAMTRAKKELIISSSGELSDALTASLELFNTDTVWEDYVYAPASIPEGAFSRGDNGPTESLRFESLTGRDLLYTDVSLGLSVRTQERLTELVRGKSVYKGKKPVEWKSMGELMRDMDRAQIKPHMFKIFGPGVFVDVNGLFIILKRNAEERKAAISSIKILEPSNADFEKSTSNEIENSSNESEKKNKSKKIDKFKSSIILKENNSKKSSTPRYSDEVLAEFKQLIEKKLEEAHKDYLLLKQTLANTDNNGTDDTSPSFKLIEDGSETLSREETAQLAGRQEKFIKHLEDALLRIRNKTYGICRVTGELISKERLRLVPHATLSIEAKQRMRG
jgi:superfamily I DNA/RNA helicase/RNA polymerase-binding transcription factor DksA